MMRKVVLRISLIASLMILNYNICIAQDISRLCIYFEQHEKNMEMSFNKDSTSVAFNILRKGFETIEKRKSAKEEFYKGNFHSEPPVDFYIVFLSNRKPDKFKSLKNINGCAVKICLSRYRESDFKYPDGVGDSKVYLVQKFQNGIFLKWNAIMMASE